VFRSAVGELDVDGRSEVVAGILGVFDPPSSFILFMKPEPRSFPNASLVSQEPVLECVGNDSGFPSSRLNCMLFLPPAGEDGSRTSGTPGMPAGCGGASMFKGGGRGPGPGPGVV
jgi:hypothetical protein